MRSALPKRLHFSLLLQVDTSSVRLLCTASSMRPSPSSEVESSQCYFCSARSSRVSFFILERLHFHRCGEGSADPYCFKLFLGRNPPLLPLFLASSSSPFLPPSASLLVPPAFSR